MTWYVYLLECADSTLYCGVTTQPDRRIAQHNGEQPGGARYTSGRRPVVLRALATCGGRSEALKLEAQIRRLPRARKLAALGLVDNTSSGEAPPPQAPPPGG